ncbi:hypothetical protein ACPWSH_26040, partial [Pandoraea pneumonica]|uniref:hypothetical protein n=1 Tax=Pandoraea pneumonica TaxID=2508299 RepID=UPI003CF83D7A
MSCWRISGWKNIKSENWAKDYYWSLQNRSEIINRKEKLTNQNNVFKVMAEFLTIFAQLYHL